jgi:hypothetical protein
MVGVTISNTSLTRSIYSSSVLPHTFSTSRGNLGPHASGMSRVRLRMDNKPNYNQSRTGTGRKLSYVAYADVRTNPAP